MDAQIGDVILYYYFNDYVHPCNYYEIITNINQVNVETTSLLTGTTYVNDASLSFSIATTLFRGEI